jgi:DNA helicase-2/ATP-dependent DNA helicase PcrA
VGKQSLDRLVEWSADRGISLLEGAAAAASCPGLSKRAQTALAQFARLFDGLAADSRGGVAMLVAAVLDRTGYRAMLESEEDEEGQDRLANVEELITVARDVDEAIAESGKPGEDDALGAFLERTALVSDTDDWDAAADRVSLMTLHAAKGLEFKVVYLVALEEGICPHERSVDHPDQLEEERRLVFVGITRGREEVRASCARIRDYRGQRRINAPSLFLTELVGEETVLEGPEAPSSPTPSRLAGWPPRSGWDDTTQIDPRADEEPSYAEVDFADADEGLPSHGRRPRGFGKENPQAAEAVAYTEGQRVRHAEYGEGVIERIGGTGAKAIGTIHFDGDEVRRTFILAHAPLERL